MIFIFFGYLVFIYLFIFENKLKLLRRKGFGLYTYIVYTYNQQIISIIIKCLIPKILEKSFVQQKKFLV